MELVIAHGDLLEQILDDTFPIWHEGLTRKAYGQWNAAQMRTPWGADHLQRFALVDRTGLLLATAKRYRFDVRLDDRALSMCGIGAVFTPPGLRRRGYAGVLIERLIEQERTAGSGDGRAVLGDRSIVLRTSVLQPRAGRGGHRRGESQGRRAGDARAGRRGARSSVACRDARHPVVGCAFRRPAGRVAHSLRARQEADARRAWDRRGFDRWSSTSPRKGPRLSPT